MDIRWVKSLRATILRSAKRSERAIFHAKNRGSNVGRTHCEGCGTPLVNPDRLAPGFIGKSHSLVPRRILRTCRENIAHNTLPYNFTRVLPLPHSVQHWIVTPVGSRELGWERALATFDETAISVGVRLASSASAPPMDSSMMRWAPLKLPGNAAAIMAPVAPPGDTIGKLQTGGTGFGEQLKRRM